MQTLCLQDWCFTFVSAGFERRHKESRRRDLRALLRTDTPTISQRTGIGIATKHELDGASDGEMAQITLDPNSPK